MRQLFDLLKSGSDSYNRDVADIKWVVSVIEGILKRVLSNLPEGFEFTADLYKEHDDWPAWGIRFALWSPRSGKKSVDITLRKVIGGSRGHVPWTEVRWALFNPDIPPEIASKMAENLDEVISAALDALPGVGTHSATKSIAALIRRGKDKYELGRAQ